MVVLSLSANVSIMGHELVVIMKPISLPAFYDLLTSPGSLQKRKRHYVSWQRNFTLVLGILDGLTFLMNTFFISFIFTEHHCVNWLSWVGLFDAELVRKVSTYRGLWLPWVCLSALNWTIGFTELGVLSGNFARCCVLLPETCKKLKFWTKL